MSTTVLAPSGLEISSNTDTGESAASMLETLSGKKAEKTPRVLVDKGQKVGGDDKAKDETSRAASTLGKKGGEAAAKARKLEAKAKPADEKPEAKEAKPDDDKAKDEKAAKGKADLEEDDDDEADEGKEKRGNPRHDPKARISVLAREKREAQEERDRLRLELEEVRRAPAARQDAQPARDTRTAADPAARATHEDPSDPRPKLDDYDGEGAYEKFVEDTSRWAARDENRKVQTRQAHEDGHREVVKTISTHVDTFHERLTGLRGDDKTAQGAAFGEFMSALPDALVSKLTPSFMIPRGEDGRPVVQPGPANLITDLIIKSEKPREILEHFADDMDDFQRIAALRDPLQIAGEMAILSHRLDAVTADTSSEREVSRAGSPGRSVSGSPRAAEPNLSGADFEEHMRRKRAAQK